MQLDKIQYDSPKVPELIMEAIVNAIGEGKIKVGKELPPERDLAEQLGVGRGSLRECLAILEFMGAIESRGNRKVLLRNADYIRQISSWIESASQISAQETFNEFRRVIEVGNVELACKRATEADFRAIEKAIEAMDNDFMNYMHDVEFHDAIAVASHNAMLASTIHMVNNLIADVRIRFWDLPNYQQITQKSHRAIYEAIKARDVQRAQLEMILHLNIVKEYSEKYPKRSRGVEEAPLPD
ncbi:MAG: FadR family transcriptional regulator [Oscillospiraceae bacterium]|nr:FadR family transcriptional regulator [Oscillospiraceae bacterium]